MKSRLGYFLQFIGKSGIFGYLFLAGMAAGFILSVQHAPVAIISSYTVVGLIFWFALFRGFVEAERLNDIGLDGEAEILTLAENGSSIQVGGSVPKPGVTMTVRVSVPGKAPYEAKIRTFISPFEIARFNPGNKIQVKVDPEKPSNLVIAEGTPTAGRFQA